ncbi:MAG: hypothetical protein ACYCZ1_09560 [Candidatus Humimicrobiaceae bacterium]
MCTECTLWSEYRLNVLYYCAQGTE